MLQTVGGGGWSWEFERWVQAAFDKEDRQARLFCHLSDPAVHLMTNMTAPPIVDAYARAERQPPAAEAVGGAALCGDASAAQILFHEQLLENMHDGVVFFDADLNIQRWNHAIETLTGISAACAEHQPWDPAILQMRDQNFKLVTIETCPVVAAVRSGKNITCRLVVSDAKQEKVSVDAHIVPVVGADGRAYGATLLLQDASSRVSLEERVQTLHEKARQDGLTRVANRAELDRVHQEWVRVHLEQGVPYSMIICDLDHFKKVNDTYGHQAGDEALITFASLLKESCHSGELVARYGGEEFVVLCPGCDNAAASLRAEAIREALAAQTHAILDGKCITASFGVTELQPGDTPEMILGRADRALLKAKNEGRNVVVSVGPGADEELPVRFRRRSWFAWFRPAPGQLLLSRKVITAVPLKLALEKLRGFIADNGADLLEISERRVVLQLAPPQDPLRRRGSGRRMPVLIELELREIPWDTTGGDVSCQRTVVHVSIRPRRQRDRLRRGADQIARRLLGDLKSYLMAQDYDRLGK